MWCPFKSYFLLINASCDLQGKKVFFDCSFCEILRNLQNITKKNIFAVIMEGRGLCLLVFPNWKPFLYFFLVIAGILESPDQLMSLRFTQSSTFFWLLAAPKFKWTHHDYKLHIQNQAFPLELCKIFFRIVQNTTSSALFCDIWESFFFFFFFSKWTSFHQLPVFCSQFQTSSSRFLVIVPISRCVPTHTHAHTHIWHHSSSLFAVSSSSSSCTTQAPSYRLIPRRRSHLSFFFLYLLPALDVQHSGGSWKQLENDEVRAAAPAVAVGECLWSSPVPSRYLSPLQEGMGGGEGALKNV